jgi:polyphosphate glucokinase
VVGRLFAALQPDYIVLGGGNVKKLKELPLHCRLGKNSNAFRGGFRLWEEDIPGHTVVAGKGHK